MNSQSTIQLRGISIWENDKHWHMCLNLDYRSSEAEEKIQWSFEAAVPLSLHHRLSTISTTALPCQISQDKQQQSFPLF